MNTRKSIFAAALTTLGLLAAPTAAEAFSLGGHLSSDGTRSDGSAWEADNAYNALFENNDSGAFTSFVAENRFGDRGGYAEKEFKLFDHNGSNAETNFNWINNSKYDFTLEYKESNWVYSLFEYETENLLASVTNTFTNPFNNIFIRTRAEKGTSMTIDNLFLNGLAVGDSSSASDVTGDFAVDYLRILLDEDEASQPFLLSGTSTMSWGENPGTLRSALASQVKVVNIPGSTPEPVATPEPTVIFGLGLASAGMTLLRRRQNG